MALFLQHKENAVQWGVWKMEESVEELLALLPHPEEYEEGLLRFTASHRRLEWLSVRMLLYRLLGESKNIEYEPSGKPYLGDRSFFISISHTKGYVAVILSGEAEVGIDIEQYGQRIHKVAHKFMREDENADAYHGDTAWGLLLHWSAKEVMFKCMDTAEVDFREHLHIDLFELQKQGAMTAQEYRTGKQRHFQIHYQIHPDFVLAWQISNTCSRSSIG